MIEEILKEAFEPSTLEKVKSETQGLPFISFSLSEIRMTTLIMTWITMGIIILLAYLATRRLKRLPGRCQSLVEIFIEAFDKLINEAMGISGRRYYPLITTLFIFVLVSNWLSIIPPLKNPTADLNTTLGLGIMVFIVAHTSGIISKGIVKYIKGFFEPIVLGPLALLLNIAGEFGKTISHSFRLFGNIFGGGLILVIVFEIPDLLRPTLYECLPGRIFYFGLWPSCKIIFPLILTMFFGLFIGAVQAFIFAILALTYITIARD